MKIDIKRRGLSPIVASVLLILMVVVLISMIFLWGRTFLEEQTGDSERPVGELCSSVNFNVMLDGSNVLEIINLGNVNISALELKMYSTGNSEIIKIDVNIPAGESVRHDVSFIGNIGSFDEIEVFPVLSGGSSKKQFTCYKDSVFLLNF